MPELTTNQIAYIIIAFIVIAFLIVVFIVIGYNPFSSGSVYAKCNNLTREYCNEQANPQACWANLSCKEPL